MGQGKGGAWTLHFIAVREDRTLNHQEWPRKGPQLEQLSGEVKGEDEVGTLCSSGARRGWAAMFTGLGLPSARSGQAIAPGYTALVTVDLEASLFLLILT